MKPRPITDTNLAFRVKALTIRQPWATLIALGVKTIETRSWRAPQALIGQTLAIHAGKHRPKDVWCSASADPVFPPPLARLYDYGKCVDPQESNDGEWWRYRWDGPLGAIVATATLADCVPMVAMHDDCDNTCVVLDGDRARIDHAGELRLTDVTDQLPYGDFAPGRWAWLLTNVQPTTNRCPACRGTGHIPADLARGEFWHCHICGDGVKVGYGRCQPIPTKGKQGVWTWQP